MAHVVLVIDADRSRREAFATRVHDLFADLPGTTTNTIRAGDMICLWAAVARAPVSIFQDHDSCALLLGYAIDDAGAWLTARDLHDRRRASSDGICDGYHAAVTFGQTQGVTVAVDPCGLFPLYHSALGTGMGDQGGRCEFDAGGVWCASVIRPAGRPPGSVRHPPRARHAR